VKGDLTEQLATFKALLNAGPYPSDSPLLLKARGFLNQFPGVDEKERKQLRVELHKAFGLPVPKPEPFEELIPSRGWLRGYYDYTLQSEPPAVFHFMCALTILGATMERSIYVDKGYYRVYPNVATVLIAPTGRCRKTGATNTSISLARAVDVNVLSERITPEALVLGLGAPGRETASGLVYAPELAVFLGRSKYLEGMVPLLTSLFDSPSKWATSTIGRGASSLKDVALSLLGASTLEWFREALPREAFSGGFMARILFVVQEDTVREFAFPEPGPGEKWEKLREQLLDMKAIRGEVELEGAAKTWHERWYHAHRKVTPPDERFSGYYARKPDHLHRMAFLIRLAEAQSLTVKVEDYERALAILDWMENRLPAVFETAAGTPEGVLHQRLLMQIKDAGGTIAHSRWLQKNMHSVNAAQFRMAVDTLIGSENIEEIRKQPNIHEYKIIKEKEK